MAQKVLIDQGKAWRKSIQILFTIRLNNSVNLAKRQLMYLWFLMKADNHSGSKASLSYYEYQHFNKKVAPLVPSISLTIE
jgi:hypothetical protein